MEENMTPAEEVKALEEAIDIISRLDNPRVLPLRERFFRMLERVHLARKAGVDHEQLQAGYANDMQQLTHDTLRLMNTCLNQIRATMRIRPELTPDLSPTEAYEVRQGLGCFARGVRGFDKSVYRGRSAEHGEIGQLLAQAA